MPTRSSHFASVGGNITSPSPKNYTSGLNRASPAPQGTMSRESPTSKLLTPKMEYYKSLVDQYKRTIDNLNNNGQS